MADFAAMHTLDIWYAHMTEHDIQDAMRAVQGSVRREPAQSKTKTQDGKKNRAPPRPEGGRRPESGSAKRANKTLRKAHARDSLGACPSRRGRRRPPSHRQPTTRHHPAARLAATTR